MTISSNFFPEVDQSSQEQWEKFLKAELKLEDISSKTRKNSPDGLWPTLSLRSESPVQIPSHSAWKKAAQTYVHPPQKQTVLEDLSHGVKTFFIEKDFWKQDQLDQFFTILASANSPQELEVFLLGDQKLSAKNNSFLVVDESEFIHGRGAFAPGGNNIQELTQISTSLISSLSDARPTYFIAVFIGPQFFRNIAKIRAARLLSKKILDEAGLSSDIRIVALTSYREWTLFERYSNVLRNDAAVASAYIAGADHIQSSGYQSIFELETSDMSKEHSARSNRIARNTSHILALESLLGVVGDAAFGSYHIESLTQELCEKSWNTMQEFLPISEKQHSEEMMKVTTPVREERRRQMNTRKMVVAGINDFPDSLEELKDISIKKRFYRLAHDFEELRLKMQKSPQRPEVTIALFGDYGALNGRINFVKNYFELLGLKVNDPAHSVTDKAVFQKNLQNQESKILVLCSSDELYPEIAPLVQGVKAGEKFIAGKVEVAGFKNLTAGQNVYDILSGLVQKWSGQ